VDWSYQTIETYLAPLITKYDASRNAIRAKDMKRYMKNQFEFLGLDATTRRKILFEFIKEFGYPPIEKLEDFSLYLWQLPEREFQHSAIEIQQKMAKKLRKEDIFWIEKLIVTKSWWDTVDGLSAWICGAFFKLYPDQIKPVTGRWMESGNIWLQRASLLFQLKYKMTTDTTLLADYIQKLADHKEFFIRKAIGWILREYSKNNPDWVSAFVKRQALSGLSYREASKYI
jgi:3-methyladenine DNA glycosylase AlkD